MHEYPSGQGMQNEALPSEYYPFGQITGAAISWSLQ
jgi:hypothetical protein